METTNETITNPTFVEQVEELIELIQNAASEGPDWDVLPDLATGDKIVQGNSAYREDGTIIVGTMVDNGAIVARLTGDLPTYTVPAGYHNGEGVVKTEVEEKTVIPSINQTVVTPSAGKLLSKVIIKPSLQSKNVTITEVPQTITPDSGYSGLAEVVVEALGSEYVKVQKQTSSSNVSVGSASATATLDFVPDIFILTNSSYTSSYSFTEKNNNTLTVYVSSSLAYKCVRNNNIVTISRNTGSGTQSFSYIAIKYTN